MKGLSSILRLQVAEHQPESGAEPRWELGGGAPQKEKKRKKKRGGWGGRSPPHKEKPPTPAPHPTNNPQNSNNSKCHSSDNKKSLFGLDRYGVERGWRRKGARARGAGPIILIDPPLDFAAAGTCVSTLSCVNRSVYYG